jgi:threonylcarbamoyladenosine tRNA methylthiotransferase MtaB
LKFTFAALNKTLSKTAAFYTLGCKLNFSETSTIARQLIKGGYSKVDFEEKADIYVINTCSVTESADKKCRDFVRRSLRKNPDAFVAVIGCYAQLKPKEIANIPGVDLVLGANEKFNLLSHLNQLEKQTEVGIHACEVKDVKEFVPAFSSGDRTRTFLKVQDGCDYFCAFCTIPLARGFSRSETIEKTLASAQKAAYTGVKEIVLTGVNLGDFGTKNGESFFELIQELDRLKGIERFRISSIEPNLLTNEIIEFVGSSEKFVPHFHIPLQSGSDKTLKAMRRRYDTKLYAERINYIKTLMPDCCIGVDVIVGFPGETEVDFLETYHFLNELPISYLHVFTYSERENTTALRILEVVPMKERQSRNKMLTILSEKKKRAFYESQIGKKCQVLFEQENDNGNMFGFTPNYVKVKIPFQADYVNQIKAATLAEIDFDGNFKLETSN